MEPARRACAAEANPVPAGSGTSPRRRAVIDVGTNSVKLLVAEATGGDVRPLCEESRQTRLGRGFYDTRRLQPDAIARTAQAVAEFARTAREKNAAAIRVIATSAARDATNAGELIAAVRRASGLRMEIISGEQEADWAFRGVTTNAELSERPLLLLDVGGGSTEFILGRGAHQHFARSFPLGTVRLLEKFPHSDPPARSELNACRDWIKGFLRDEIRPDLEPALQREDHAARIVLVGTGGTTGLLARLENKLEHFDRERIERTVLSLGQVVDWRKRLWGLPLPRRKEIAGLPQSRADVILTGVLIYEIVMTEFGFQQLRVSTRGLRFAVVME
ncbi:MAG: Ppx/GppA family phosphatase [Verrucomicrobiota bacterium]|nr:Ppx/GppA family phosphatase [Verrucomicrobiota bacterium]